MKTYVVHALNKVYKTNVDPMVQMHILKQSAPGRN